MQHLTRSYGDWANPAGYEHALLFTGIGIAHELVHTLRGLVQPLLMGVGIVIPDATPPKLSTATGRPRGRLGGTLRRLWSAGVVFKVGGTDLRPRRHRRPLPTAPCLR